jgi:DNA-directed RNA polymerase subunit RPC12/RpoP
MICSCPKCAAQIDKDLAEIPENGTATQCPQCKSRLLIARESFAKRAYRQAGDINCVKCGNKLGHELHCPACGELYPDYFVTEVPDIARKQARKIIETFKNLKDFSFEWGTSSTTPQPGYTPQRRALVITPKSAGKPRKVIWSVASLIVVVALVAIGVWHYKQQKAEQIYAANFVKVLYIVKTGTDQSLAACEKISGDWKTKMAEGRSIVPRLSAEDDSDLSNIAQELDKRKVGINLPPKKFATAYEKLEKLNGIFAKARALAMAPPGSPSSLSESANKLAGEFKAASQELKAGLSTELAAELAKGRTKYRGLREF